MLNKSDNFDHYISCPPKGGNSDVIFSISCFLWYSPGNVLASANTLALKSICPDPSLMGIYPAAEEKCELGSEVICCQLVALSQVTSSTVTALGAQLPLPKSEAHPSLWLSDDSHPQLEMVPWGHLAAAEIAQLSYLTWPTAVNFSLQHHSRWFLQPLAEERKEAGLFSTNPSLFKSDGRFNTLPRRPYKDLEYKARMARISSRGPLGYPQWDILISILWPPFFLSLAVTQG